MARWYLLAALGIAVFALAAASQPSPDAALRPATAAGFASIVGGAVITQGYGCTTVVMEPVDLACASGHFHAGVDLAAAYGTPVFAAAAGLATVVDSMTGYGLHVLIQHGPTLQSLYGHLERALVASGQLVRGGDEIGLLGSSGMSTGPHVHFEIDSGGVPVDPQLWLPVLQDSQPERRAGAS